MKSLFVLVLCLSALTIFGFRIEYTEDNVRSERFQNNLEDHTELYQTQTTNIDEYTTNEEVTLENEVAIEHNETLANEQRLEVENLFKINEEDTTVEVGTTGIIDISENLVQSDNETRIKDDTVSELNGQLQHIFNNNQAISTTSIGQLSNRAGANLIIETNTQYPKASTINYDDDICDDITEENKTILSDVLIQSNQQTLTRISDVENENILMSTAQNEESPVTDDMTFDEADTSSSRTTEAGDALITNEEPSISGTDDNITQSRHLDFFSEFGIDLNQENQISTSTEGAQFLTQVSNVAGKDTNRENQNNVLSQLYRGSFEPNIVNDGSLSPDNALENNENTPEISDALDQTISVSNFPTLSENVSDQVIGTDVTSTTTMKYEDHSTPTQVIKKIIPTGFSTAGVPIFTTNTFNNLDTVPNTETTILPSTTPVLKYQEDFSKISVNENQQNLFGNGFYQGKVGTVTDAPSTTKFQSNFGTTIFEDQPNLHRFGFGTRFNGFTFNQPTSGTTTLRNDVSSSTLGAFNFTPTQSYADIPASNLQDVEVSTNTSPFITSSQRTSVVILNEPSTIAPPFSTSTQTTLDTNIQNQYDLFDGIQTTFPSEITSTTTFAPIRGNVAVESQAGFGQFDGIQTTSPPEITSTTFSPIRGNVDGVITPPQSNVGSFNKFGDQNYRSGSFADIQTSPPSEITSTTVASGNGNLATAFQPSLGQFNRIQSTTFSPIRGNVAGIVTPPQPNLGLFNKFGNQNAPLGLFTGVQKTPPSEVSSTTFTPIRGNVGVTPGAITPPHPSLELFSKFGDQESRLPTTMDRGKATLPDVILPPKEGRLESTTEGLVQAIFSGQISFDNSTNSKPKKGSFFNLQSLGGFNLVSVTKNTVPAISFQRTSRPPLTTPPRPTIQKPASQNPKFSLGIIDRYTSSNLKIDTVNLGKTGSINRLGDSSKTTFFNGLHLYNPSFATFLK